MYTNPHIGGDRQRDMRARAERQRHAHERPEQHPGWILRTLAKLRIPRPARPVTEADPAGGPQP